MSGASGPQATEFEALYHRTARRVWGALGRSGIVREVERRELAQDVFVIAYQKFEARPRASEDAWVIAIAKFVARDYRKLRRVQEEQPMLDPGAVAEPAAAGRNPEEIAADRRAYLTLIGALDDDDRIVFEMHEGEGFEAPEIARALAKPEGTIRTQLKRAREKLTAARSRMRAREEHALARLGLPAVLPFGAGAWRGAGSVFDDAPPDVGKALWDGVRRAIARHGATRALDHVATAGAVAAAKASMASFTGGLLIGGSAVATLALGAHLLTAQPVAPAGPTVIGRAVDSTPAAVVAANETPSATAAPLEARPAAAPLVPVSAAVPIANASAAPVGIDPEEMRLYQQAVAASRSGNLDAAAAALDEHARRFPRGTFAKDRERMRAAIDGARNAGAPDGGPSRRPFGADE